MTGKPGNASVGIEPTLSLMLSSVAQTTAGDQVREAYEAHHRAIYRHLLMLGVAPPHAEELCHECFIRLFGVLQRDQTIHNMRAWLFTTASRLAFNYLESARVHRRHATAWIDTVVEQQHDPGPDPEQTALQHERFVRLHRAVEELSVQQKRCLYLRAEGFRYREIADMTGLSLSTVVEFVRRGLARLKKLHA